MPKKLQIKLLSNSGELLNVVTCYAGQVAVFRANSPADLRPYQRALTGTQGKERFNVSVDGLEYDSDRHVLIGLGEQPPYNGLTVGEYLIECGVPEASVFALLSSYGLEHTIDKNGPLLSPDEDRRVRLLAATCSPQKILVTSEPFEPITSQWKDRFAELLSSYARQKNAIVVVTSLSSRPECWIDNEAISRVQVGETIQRTIGFGSAGSESTALMNQLKDLFRDDAKVQEILQKHPSSASSPTPTGVTAAAMAIGGAALTNLENVESDNFGTPLLEPSSATWWSAEGLRTELAALWVAAPKATLGSIAFGCLGIAAFYSALTQSSETSPEPVSTAPSAIASLDGSPHTPASDTSDQGVKTMADNQSPPSIAAQSNSVAIALPDIRADVTRADVTRADVTRARFILDEYPEPVKISLLDTTRGVSVDSAGGPEAAASDIEVPKQPQRRAAGGNLFKLLESASTNQADKPSDEDPAPPGAGDHGAAPSSWSEPSDATESDQNDEQQRREAIRQKFLEAIRAAAEKRQASVDGR